MFKRQLYLLNEELMLRFLGGRNEVHSTVSAEAKVCIQAGVFGCVQLTKTVWSRLVKVHSNSFGQIDR